jgi:hypothetical protein
VFRRYCAQDGSLSILMGLLRYCDFYSNVGLIARIMSARIVSVCCRKRDLVSRAAQTVEYPPQPNLCRTLYLPLLKQSPK